MKSFFKKLGKIAAVAVGAAAVAFTAGSAISGSDAAGGGGIFSGGWSGISRSIGDLFGEGTTLSNVVGGAVKYGGYGSLVGGAVNAVRGKSITDGMKTGALGGAATGGLLGGLNMAGLPKSQGAAGSGDLIDGGSEADGISGGAGDDMLATADKTPIIEGGAGVDKVASAGTVDMLGGNATSGGGNGLLTFINQNPAVAGMAVQGAGQGLSGYAQSSALEESSAADRAAAMERQTQQQEYIRGNYGSGDVDPGKLAAPVPEGTQTPSERFDPSTYSGRYVWNRATGNIEFQRDQQA